MRNLLKSLRSSVSSRQQQQQHHAQAQLQPDLEEGSSSDNDHHHENDNVDVKVDPKKQQLQDEIGDNSLHEPGNGQHSYKNENDTSILDLQDVTRITKRDTKKERRMKYKHCFERNNVVMTVSKDDIILDQESENEEENDDNLYFDSDLYKGTLAIPRDNHSTVPNCCVICLEEYQPGNRVVWSTNAECEHAFHRDCIVKYFDKIQRKVADTPCPCCRATYTDLTVELRSKKRGGPGRRRIRTTTGTGSIVAGIPWFR